MKTGPKILIADRLQNGVVETLRQAGIEADVRTGLSEEQLCGLAGKYDGLIVRSATKVTARVVEAGKGRLRIIGRAGVGVDNIDIRAATEAGIIVQNTPTGNITSAAEHALALLFASARNIPRADREMKAGIWDSKGCTGVELTGKILGIIGLGKVGKIVARVAHSLGMNVLVCDPYVTVLKAEETGAIKVDIDDLLQRADFVSVHAPLTAETRNLLNSERLRMMKPGARLINTARGGIVNEADLATALREGVIAAAAADVFANEPLEEGSPLRELDNMILTPHLGASTEEAQARVAEEIATQFVEFFVKGTIRNAVNLNMVLDPNIAPYAQLADSMGQMVGQMVRKPVQQVEVGCYGQLAKKETKQLSISVLRGLLRGTTETPVTLVNAPLLAEARGIELVENRSERSPTYASLLTVAVTTAAGRHMVGGTCFDGEEARIVQIDQFFIDVKPASNLLLMFYPDRPGMVGKFGTILGEAGINIANMAVGRWEKRGRAAVVLTVDDPVTDEVVAQIKAIGTIEELYAITIDL